MHPPLLHFAPAPTPSSTRLSSGRPQENRQDMPMFFRWSARLLSLVALLCATAAPAHTGSTAYIETTSTGSDIALTWRVALRDLDLLVELDADRSGTLAWDEVQARAAAVQAFAAQAMIVKAGAAPCAMTPGAPTLVKDPEHDFASVALRGACSGGVVTLTYTAFAGIDDKHRALVRVNGAAEPQVLAPGASLTLSGEDTPHSFVQFYREGIGHILGGLDHLLFLIALMLPAVLVRDAGQWQPRTDRKAALIRVVWLATAFTIAHSITLGLAAFGVVRLPPSVIEPLVAATVLAAALNNLWPVVTRKLAWIAFVFGLIHGFAFAEILAPLNLPRGDLALALLGFNLGVETGQLMVVAVCFVLLALAAGWRGYPRWVLHGGSAVVALLACAWIVERVFDVTLFG
jgi:hypothetical protein